MSYTHKPVFHPTETELVWLDDEQINGLCIYLSDKTIAAIGDFSLKSLEVKEREKGDELWAEFEKGYVVLMSLSAKTLECIHGKELQISFFSPAVKTLLGLRLNQ